MLRKRPLPPECRTAIRAWNEYVRPWRTRAAAQRNLNPKERPRPAAAGRGQHVWKE
jgi:hypothetical protein